MTRLRLAIVGLVLAATHPLSSAAQVDSTLAQEGLYDRPFIGSISSTSVGGYVEGNTNWFVQEGVSEGVSMELRRFNIFLFSQVSARVRMLAEVEFEHGTEEIALETALVDLQIGTGVVLRGGILLPPLGFVNQNHDSPRWDFVERPMVSTGIIPSTLSEIGFGAYGKLPAGSVLLSYDIYAVNGLGDGIVANDEGRTDVPSGKHEERFGEDNNGSPALTARLAVRAPRLGELGVSYYGGYYNSFRSEGTDVDERRWLGIAALDIGVGIGPVDIRAEAAYASIDVPAGLEELFATTQWGAHLDVLAPVWRPHLLGYYDSVLSVGLRLEHVDLNAGTFASTGLAIGDEVTAIVPTVSLRTTADTVLRVNYRYEWATDFPGNRATRRAGIQVGFATYF